MAEEQDFELEALREQEEEKVEPRKRSHEEMESVKCTKKEQPKPKPVPYVPYELITDEVREMCFTWGKVRPGKGGAADILPLIWNDKKFREMMAKDNGCVPLYSLANSKQLCVDGPWMKFTFGYKPRTKKGEDGKEATSNTLRMEFARQGPGDDLDKYKKWLENRDLWLLKKAYENRNSWGEKFQKVLATQLRKGETEVDLVNHVQQAWKWTTKSDTTTTFADGLNFNLMTQTRNDALGIKDEDKFSCALVVWSYDRKLLTRGLTYKNAIDYKLADANPLIRPGMYGKPVCRESHLAICPKDFGLTNVLEEVRLATEEQLFPDEEIAVCAF